MEGEKGERWRERKERDGGREKREMEELYCILYTVMVLMAVLTCFDNVPLVDPAIHTPSTWTEAVPATLKNGRQKSTILSVLGFLRFDQITTNTQQNNNNKTYLCEMLSDNQLVNKFKNRIRILLQPLTVLISR